MFESSGEKVGVAIQKVVRQADSRPHFRNIGQQQRARRIVGELETRGQAESAHLLLVNANTYSQLHSIVGVVAQRKTENIRLGFLELEMQYVVALKPVFFQNIIHRITDTDHRTYGRIQITSVKA